jgi:hypothetical protein
MYQLKVNVFAVLVDRHKKVLKIFGGPKGSFSAICHEITCKKRLPQKSL